MAAQPSVDDIEHAHALNAQLAALNSAIAVLDQRGSSLGGIYCIPPPPDADSTTEPPEPVNVRLDPPLDDPQVINTLVNTMQTHARAIQRELADMGFTPGAAVGQQPHDAG